MNEINCLPSCVLNSRVRVGHDVGTIKFIGEVNNGTENDVHQNLLLLQVSMFLL